MRRRSIVALLVYLPTNAVLFGIGAVTILVVPALNARADVLIPIVVAASFVLAAPIAWMLAPRLQARSFRRWGDPADATASQAGVAEGGRPRPD
ncbi:hypothetical protein ACTZWW_12405 [Salinarimonas sp. NSM]|uniref:hypothetical protein n=1 Tax=Salinarimonas sp. NSM TaxID=3458003 RepID=UPI004035D2C7